MITTLKQQAKDLFGELNKVEWPNKEKVTRYTWAVCILSVIVGLYLWGADWAIAWLMKFFLPNH